MSSMTGGSMFEISTGPRLAMYSARWAADSIRASVSGAAAIIATRLAISLSIAGCAAPLAAVAAKAIGARNTKSKNRRTVRELLRNGEYNVRLRQRETSSPLIRRQQNQRLGRPRDMQVFAGCERHAALGPRVLRRYRHGHPRAFDSQLELLAVAEIGSGGKPSPGRGTAWGGHGHATVPRGESG